MTIAARPKNLLEYYINEASAKRTAEKIAEEAKTQERQRLGIWNWSMDTWIAPSIAEKLPGLRKIETKDQSGRTITSWEGHPSTWMKDFASPPRRLTAINTK
jgi:hypothetical protein